MTKYKCPRCKGRVIKSVIQDVPTRDRYECTKCEYVKEVPDKNQVLTAPE